jgi:hypothetical protein
MPVAALALDFKQDHHIEIARSRLKASKRDIPEYSREQSRHLFA